jgi:hypothetical protein
MKTAVSSIKNELGKFITDLALNKLNHWAYKEFKNIRHSEAIPVCMPMSDTSWVLGQFEIAHIGPNRWQVSTDNKLVNVFYSKQSAVFYSFFTYMRYYKTADTILLQDRDVARLTDELDFYSKKMNKKNSKFDAFKMQLWDARYLEIKSQLRIAREELEKSLQSAKYCKIWEKIL